MEREREEDGKVLAQGLLCGPGHQSCEMRHGRRDVWGRQDHGAAGRCRNAEGISAMHQPEARFLADGRPVSSFRNGSYGSGGVPCLAAMNNRVCVCYLYFLKCILMREL